MSAYQVLARKYRPQQFSEIVGQDHIVRTLENSIKAKRIAHAYLFVGPRGTGKTTVARIFAKALNCSKTKEPTVTPCGECSNCKEITSGNSMDVLEIDGASNNSVEQVRELRETVRYAPTSARFKVIYIDEVHMLSTPAFNALLKTLEEPPAHVTFLFATTDPQKIPLTILSRCQRFDLHRIPNDLIIKHLKKIGELEKVRISDSALLAIARGASGGMRDAESALDQIIAFCGNNIEEADILSIFGLAAREQVSQLTQGILEGERAGIVNLASALHEEGKDLGRLLGELIEHFRNVLVLQAGADVTDATLTEMTELKEHARKIPRGRTLRILEILTEAENQLRWTLSKKVLFEVTLLKAVETKDEVLLADLIAKLKETAESIPTSGFLDQRTETQKPQVALSPALVRSASIPSSASGESQKGSALQAKEPPVAATVSADELWKQLLEQIAKPFPMLKSSLMEGRLLSVGKDLVVIGFDPEFELQKELVDTPKNREMIQSKIREITGKMMTIKVGFADDPSIPQGDETPSSPSIPASSRVSLDDAKKFEDDPLIKKALEIFKGQIVEIRR